MAKQQRPAADAHQPLGADDPRRPFKIRKLREQRGEIEKLAARAPELDDPEFDEWRRTTHGLLVELFGPAQLLLRFVKIDARPISYNTIHGKRWSAEPKAAWKVGLDQYDRVLGDALEELEIELPEREAPAPPVPQTSVVINNNFSPTVHVTVTQLIGRLDSLGLTKSEKEIAEEQIKELDAETKGGKRWPMIARHVEAIKSIGKGVYNEIAVPLIVEFLKREAGLGGGS